MESSPDDLTPESGSPTDVAPLGQHVPAPAHEAPASGLVVNWAAIAESTDFKALLREKLRFVIPTTIFFVVYYLALPVLVGWFPELMKTKIGSVNFAYVFALSQFFMAWAVAAIYVAKAGGWDKSAAAVLAKFNHR